MATQEQIERIRQAIMRYRELMDIMQGQLDEGDRMYKRLIAQHAPEDAANRREKEIQWHVAAQIVDDPEALKVAVRHMKFALYQMERDFEQVLDILETEPEPDTD